MSEKKRDVTCRICLNRDWKQLSQCCRTIGVSSANNLGDKMAIKIINAPEFHAAKATGRPVASLSLAALMGSFLCQPLWAAEFSLGDVEGRFDSQLSIGASWRMEDADPAQISLFNGGTLASNGVNDDGNLNYAKHDAFTKVFKGVHDLELTYENMGAFLRGKYWYDFEGNDGNVDWGHGPNGYAAGEPLNDDGFNDYAKFSGAELLDAFVYSNFDLGDMPASVRLGRQVVSWGESTFIQGGINVANPFDAAAFRRPGAEIKEGLLPVNMLFGSVGVTDALSVEAFYQLEFEPTVVDGCGTFFSTVDYIAEGCNTLTLGAVAGQLSLPFTSDSAATATGFSVSRNSDGIREASDDGQYGLALRYFAEELNSTEFGLFYMNYHSRLPVASGVSTGSDQLLAATPFTPGGAQNPSYFSEYLEDIKLLGLSFSTNVGEYAVSGELSHHQDLPLQINGADLVGSILTAGTQAGNPMNARVAAANTTTVVNGLTAGTVVNGYDRFDVSQAQVTVARFFNRVMGASRLVLVGEVAVNHIHDFDNADKGGIRYGRPSEYGQAGTDGFTTQDSWGYRARGILNYPDVVAGINLTPSLAWSHDVEGYSPVNTGFVEGRKAISLGLNADYANRYTAGLSYTRFSGGDYNITSDRDFLSATLGVSF